MLDGEITPLNTPVRVKSSWPGSLKLSVTNTAPTTLTYFAGSLAFPGVTYIDGSYAARQPSHPELAFQITAGVPSDFLLRRKDGTLGPTPQVPAIAIAPGETFVLTVSSVDANSFKKILEAVPDLSEARFFFLISWYANDTCFFNGSFQKVADVEHRRLQPINDSGTHGE